MIAQMATAIATALLLITAPATGAASLAATPKGKPMPPTTSTTSPADLPLRLVLEGVRPLTFEFTPDRPPMTIPWPATLAAAIEKLGDGLGEAKAEWRGKEHTYSRTYAHVFAVSGAAFKLSWGNGWGGDQHATWLVHRSPGMMFDHTLDTLGYSLKPTKAESPRQQKGDDAFLRPNILAALRRGVPVICHGVVGPPEESLIIGYDDGGDTLIGWSMFQKSPDCQRDVTFEPSGAFRKRNWPDDTWTLFALDKRVRQPTTRRILRDTLQWALDVVIPAAFVHEKHNGLAAYDSWVEHLGRDKEIGPDGKAANGRANDESPFHVHNVSMRCLCEPRWYAAVFLREMAAEHADLAADLRAAADCYMAEHELAWKMYDAVGGYGEDAEKGKQFGDPAVRRQIAAKVKESRQQYAKAAEHLARARKALDAQRGL